MYETQHSACLIDLVVLLLDLFFIGENSFSTLIPKAFSIKFSLV